jgi:HEAT repeat protein
MQATGSGTRFGCRRSDDQATVHVALALAAALGTTIALGWRPVAFAQAPGPELFAKDPKTPLELWDAIDYLVRTGQAKKAVPYINKFMKSMPDDAVLMAIRDRYGAGSILRLSDDPATRAFTQPLADAMVKAAKEHAVQPERLAQLITQLTKEPTEQDYAIRHLREAGPYAVPFLIDVLARPGLSPSDRKIIVQSIGALDRSAIPPLAAALASTDPSLAVDAATALGMIGDPVAVPFLTYAAAAPGIAPALHTAAQTAIERLTGRRFSAQPQSPVQVLTDAAWRYHRGQVEFPDDSSVTVWTWDKDRRALTPREVTRTQAEIIIGSQLAHQACQLAPSDHQARVAQLSIALQESVQTVGVSSFPAKDQTTFAAVKAAGPLIVTDILRTAIANDKSDVAIAAVVTLGDLTDAAALASNNRSHPLVDALVAPDRRVQFAAAKAITALAPTKPFPGSSRVVQTLARFVINQPLPRAVVIDGNPNRGSQLAGFLTSLGYDPEVELTGNLGFRAALASADVELILVSFDLFRPGWGLPDTLANLGTDARTAAIPVFIYGPLSVQYNRPNLEKDYPRVKLLVQPGEADVLQKQLKGLPAGLTTPERASYAALAASLLARISAEERSPFASDLTMLEPALSAALSRTETAPLAAVVLGNIPDLQAQRSLAAVILDPSRATDLRVKATSQLVHSIKRFGRLITGHQEARFARMVDEESDPDVRTAAGAVIQALQQLPRRGLIQPTAPAGAPVPVQTSQPVTAPSSPPRANQ